MQNTRPTALSALLVTGLLLASCQSQPNAETASAIREARAVMDRFLLHFNERDESAWAETLAFPHVRMASNTVVVYPDMATFVLNADLEAFAKQQNWAYSTWDNMEVVHASPDKVHFAVTFSRHRANHEAYATFDSLYVVERTGERWGIRARSSFAP